MERKENKDKNKLNKPIKRKGNKTETSTKPPKAKKRNLRKTDIENENKIDSKINFSIPHTPKVRVIWKARKKN
jgi:hypothetical protein